MADVRYLQHTASPFVTKEPRDRNELIRPAVEGTRRAVGAALRAKVERVVVTSSMAAIMYGHDKTRAAPFTAADWTNLEGRGISGYVESKTRAEQAAWELMDQAGRHDDLAHDQSRRHFRTAARRRSGHLGWPAASACSTAACRPLRGSPSSSSMSATSPRHTSPP